jgi:hypothetical protein
LKTIIPRISLIAVVLLAAVRPGDASFVNDESIMMEMAIRYNRVASDIYGVRLPFTPSPFGIQGTRGMRYGPLPIWIDQIFLAFTHNLAAMVACRALLTAGVTGIALAWLGDTMGLNPWFAVIVMLSPWLWFLNRSLWDSTYCIPLSALLFAAYAAFLAKPQAGPLRLVFLLCILLPLVHLMAVAIVLPVVLHACLLYRRDLWRWKWGLGLIGVVCLYLFRPYLTYVVQNGMSSKLSADSAFKGWMFPLFGGQYLTLGVAGIQPGDGWQDFAPRHLRELVAVARWVARLALPAVWLGMVLALKRATGAVWRSANASVSQHLCVIALATWIAQTILDGVERLFFSPHYYAATWIVYVFFAWIAADVLLRKDRSGFAVRGLLAVYAAALVLGGMIIAGTIAKDGGTIGPYYGTSIGNQIQAAEQIQEFKNASSIDIQIPQWELHPLTYRVLTELARPSDPARPGAEVLVRYRHGFPGDAGIVVENLPAASAPGH